MLPVKSQKRLVARFAPRRENIVCKIASISTCPELLFKPTTWRSNAPYRLVHWTVGPKKKSSKKKKILISFSQENTNREEKKIIKRNNNQRKFFVHLELLRISRIGSYFCGEISKFQ